MDSLKSSYISTEVEPFYVGSTPATVSENGEILATPLEEDVIITNLRTSEIIHKIEGDGELVTSLSITPDATKLAILSQSQQLRIFDLDQGEITKTFKLPSPVYISTCDSTSSLFAFGGTEGVITVWDIENGYVTHSLKGHNTTVCSLKFYGELNSANWRLGSGDIMGTSKIWDLVKRKAIASSTEHTSAVRGLDFNEDYFISGGRDEILLIYKQDNLKKVWKTYSVRHQVENCGFLKIYDQTVLYTAGSDNYLKIWNFESGQLIGTSTKPLKTTEELVILDVIKLTENKLMLIISDQTLVELNLNEIITEEEIFEIPISKRIAGNHGTIADIRYVGPNFEMVAMATNSPALRIINPEKKYELQICEGHTDLLNALDVSNDGKWIVTASKDNEARLWHFNAETENFETYAIFQGHVGSVTAVCLSKEEDTKPKFLITGSNDLTIKKWKIPDESNSLIKTSIYTRRAHDKDINSIDISPNNEFLATASYDKLGKIWDVELGETIGVLKGHKRGLWDINFCKYDQLIVTSSGDKTIKLWSLKNYQCLKTFEGHTNSVQRSKFLNKNQQVISSGADGLIKLWSIKEEGECITFDNHVNRIWALDIKQDGENFISADADGQINFWKDNSEELRIAQEQHDKVKIEQEQKLSNLINNQDWSEAFLLALTLNHSMRLYNVLKSSISMNIDPESIIGSFKLENTIKSLNDEQIMILFKKIRDWNVNFKFFEISQKILRLLINDINPEIPGLIKVIESIIPYNERHYNRIDQLIENSFILDYSIEEMNKN